MREIKFRAWDKKYKEMLLDISIYPEYDWLVMSDNDALAERDNRSYKKGKQYILMQFTGLKDKNGKEIYEGDILRAKSSVVFSGGEKKVGYKQVVVEWVGTHYRPFLQTSEYPNDFTGIGQWEVIGNIYENPELLEAR